MFLLENRKDGEPSRLFLDGSTYEPKLAPCADSSLWDYRWHPDPRARRRADQRRQRRARASRGSTSRTCAVTSHRGRCRSTVDGIGSGEGNPSNDGRFVALGNDREIFVVDMSPPGQRVPALSEHAASARVYRLPPCAERGLQDRQPLDLAVRALRRRQVQSQTGLDAQDLHRIFEVDPATLMLRPHVMAAASLRCGSFAAPHRRLVFPLKHADLALDPFDGDEDVLVGGRSCPGARLGRVVKVRLRDGKVTALTDPRDEASVSHVSTRNLDRPGWAYVTYFRGPGKRFSDEIVAVKLDGSGTVERCGRTRTASDGLLSLRGPRRGLARRPPRGLRQQLVEERRRHRGLRAAQQRSLFYRVTTKRPFFQPSAVSTR